MLAAATASLLKTRFRNWPAYNTALNLKRRFATNDCDEEEPPNPRRKELKLEKPMAPMKAAEEVSSMWENPECCIEQCENYRHDILYLRGTKRIYTRTWNECEDVSKDRYVCVGECLPPEVENRPRRTNTKQGSKHKCVGDEHKLGLMKCIAAPIVDLPCARLKMPFCKLAKDPPYCKKERQIQCCQKRCTLYPAYSECKKPKPKVSRPIECTCMKVPSTCEVFAMFRKFPIK